MYIRSIEKQNHPCSMTNLYQKSYRFILLLSFIFTVTIGYTQEDCTNGIDDDGDGLIDLQDGADCICGAVMYSEVLGDFEDYTCCPTMFTSLPNNGIYCLDDGWAPPNAGTSDYFNTCDYIGGEGALPLIPMPIPSGEGAVGFLSLVGYYESVGVCLDNPMISGEVYNLSFYIGFNATGAFNSDLDITINLYGTEDCDNFPLDTGFDADCLSSYDEWELISGIPVLGVEDTSWVFVSIAIIANMSAEAIAFGLECNVTIGQYHWIDDITIGGNFLVSTPEEELVSSGNCIDGISVELPNSSGPEYQWFLDGVAILGATTNPYVITDASAEGEYELMVIDGSECSISAPIDIIIDTDAVEIDGIVTEIQCIFNDDGMIDISTNTTNAPFEFEWSNGTTAEDILGEGPGTYTVTVTDDNGCFGTESFVIPYPDNVDATITGDCVTGIFISIDDIPIATYQWYLNGVLIPGAVTNPFLITSDFPGIYHVTATNGTICTESNPLDVDIDFEVLGIDGEVVDLLCFGIPTGSINVVTNDINQPLIYEWSSGEETQQITDLETGTYSVTVIDANGCYGEAEFTIETPTPFINTLTVVQPDMGNPGAAGIISNGGVLPYTYTWSNGFVQSSDDNLAAGSYSITVSDGNGCNQVFEFEIISDYVVIEMSSDASCATECDGSILLTIDGENTDYSVIWNNGNLSGFNPTQLCFGTYSYTVTNSDNSPYVGSITIGAPPEIIISSSFQDTLCDNATGEDISLLVSGGTSPYTYLWNTGSTNDTLFGVGPGLYSIEVIDQLGCSILDTFIIDALPLIELQFATLGTGCNGEENGTIDLTINNGLEPYSILWSNDSISEDLIDLGSGLYFVTVTDSYGCMVIDSASVTANSGIEVNTTVNHVNCNDENNGSIALEISGGQMPYDILWSNEAETESIENLSQGLYEVTIIDFAGCTWSQNYEILVNSDISIISSTQDNLCFGGADGRIELEINNANSSYSILWEDGSIVEDRLNLLAGDYNFMLIDSFGCEYLDNFIITEGEEITYQAIISEPGCNGAEDGFISISPVTGAFPISYVWSNGGIVNQIDDLPSDTYFLTITDNNACVKLDTFILSENSDVIVSETVVNNLCYGENGGSINIDINGGSEPYDILWSNDETSLLIENLSAGDYFVTVEDGNDCSSTYLYSVFEPDSLYIEDFVELPLCHDDLGRIEVQGNGGIPLYTFLWSTGETTPIVSVLPGSTYSVTITDMNLCTKSKTYIIEDIFQIDIIALSIIEPSSLNDDGTINIDVSGGTSPYSIIWDNGQTGLLVINLGVGTYTATVTDANGCNQTITIELSNDPIAVIGMATDNLCFGDCEGQIDITIEGGSEPYTITWSDGQIGSNASSLCNGTYQATIVDGLGEETVSEMYFISSPSTIIIEGLAYDISCVDIEDGAIAINSEGGEEPFDFNWSNTMIGDSIGNLGPGEYSVTVLDDNGCSESETYTIDDIPLIDIGVEVPPFDCDRSNETIILNGENTYNYPYFLNGLPIVLNADNEINGLEPGSYQLSYVINGSCVINIETIIIEEKQNIVFGLSEIEFTVFEGDEVIISIAQNEDSLLNDFVVDWNVLNPFECTIFNDDDQCLEVKIAAQESEIIEVVIIDLNGCETILEARVIVEDKIAEIHIPNIFSPNDDGINDEFTITSNSEDIHVVSMKIFNRWGNIVFIQRNTDLQNLLSWNGEFNGKKVNSNVFVYLIEVMDKDGKSEILFGDLAVVY